MNSGVGLQKDQVIDALMVIIIYMIKAHLDNSTRPKIYKHFLCIYSTKQPEFPPPGRFKQSPLMLGYNKWAHKIASPVIESYFMRGTKTKHC